MNIDIADDSREAGRRAAEAGADRLRQALDQADRAVIVLATGSSQFDMLERLVAEPGIEWPRVTAFHLDEYVGIDAAHPASFRRYLRERFVERLPQPIGAFQYIDGNARPEEEVVRLSQLIRARPIDVAFVGIGENGHLAFNDPPADFETSAPFLSVKLDEISRRQQLGEGWFASLDEVPDTAISMSVRQIMSARTIVCTECPFCLAAFSRRRTSS